MNDGVTTKQNLNAVYVEAEKGYFFLVQRNKHTQRVFVCMGKAEITANYQQWEDHQCTWDLFHLGALIQATHWWKIAGIWYQHNKCWLKYEIDDF